MSAIDATDDLWRRFARLQAQVQARAPFGTGESELAGLIVAELVDGGGCLQAVVWRVAGVQVSLLAKAGSLPESSEELSGADLLALAEMERPRVLQGGGGQVSSRLRWISVPFPLRPGESVVLELVFGNPLIDDNAHAAEVDFASAACELLGVNCLRSTLSHLTSRTRRDATTFQELLALHSAAGRLDSGAAIAAAAQCAFGFDRAWLFEIDSAGVELRGATLADVDQHADGQLPLLRRLVAAVAETGAGTRISVGGPNETSETLREMGVAYLDAAQLRLVQAEPLWTQEPKRRLSAVLVLDRYTLAEEPERDVEREQILLRNAATAWNNAERIEGGALGSVWRRFRRWIGRRKIAWGIGSGGLAAVLLALIPWPFEIRADGQLQPEGRRAVFAPCDGTVSELLVTDGARVAAGDPVMILRSPELDAERSRLAGELTTRQTRLASLQASRGQLRNGRENAPAGMAAEMEELGAAISGLRRQLELVDERQGTLRLVSPISGQVDRWNLDQGLAGRPVARGQELLRILDVEGAWQLELRIPEDDCGHVTAAQKATEALNVRFQFRTEPGETRTGTLRALSGRTEVDDQGRLWLRGIVPLEGEPSGGRRVGAGVTAQVNCGRRPVGFVWFRQMIEFIWRRWWF